MVTSWRFLLGVRTKGETMLNKQKGNMYPWVTHTWNPVKGKCPHECSYCYMKRFPQKPLRLDEKCFKDDLGACNTIFIGSSTDMWAEEVPEIWIKKVLVHCCLYPENTYLFQTKNPERFHDYLKRLPKNTILGTTMETNRGGYYSYLGHKTPSNPNRWYDMVYLEGRKMISIEPIMDFDTDEFVDMIKKTNLEFISIGADSGNNNLPEPSPDKVRALIKELKKFTDVRIKDNLKRLL